MLKDLEIILCKVVKNCGKKEDLTVFVKRLKEGKFRFTRKVKVGKAIYNSFGSE